MARYRIKFNSCDCRSHEGAARRWSAAANEMTDVLSNIGATCSLDGTYSMVVSRDDGRGLLAACRAAASRALSVYGDVRAA